MHMNGLLKFLYQLLNFHDEGGIMQDKKMVLTAVAMKAVTFSSDTMINQISTILMEKESEISIDEWEAGKKTNISISITHGDYVETLAWEIKPKKK